MITYIQIAIVVIYLSFIISKFGILPSISDSWYELEEKKIGFLFTLFLWAMGFTMFFQTMGDSGLFFLSGAGLMFTGAATEFKLASVKRIHYFGALSGLVAPLAGIWYEYHNWIPLAIAVSSIIVLKLINFKDNFFWIEISLILSIMIGFLMK